MSGRGQNKMPRSGQIVSDSSGLDDGIVADFMPSETVFRSHQRNSDNQDYVEEYFSFDVSSEALDYEDRRANLLTIIDGMVKHAPTWDGEPASVSEKSAETAKRFLKALPSNRELPKVAPDGEGDLL